MSGSYTLPNCGAIIKDGTKLLQDALNFTKVQYFGEITPQMYTSRTNMTRDVMAAQLVKALKIAERQQDYIVQFEKMAQHIKSELIERQNDIINLQSELVSAKDKRFIDMKTTVIESVEETMKTELRTYSEAVQNPQSSTGVMDTANLHQVVKDVVAEEDRGRNIMIFGLEEVQNDNISDDVTKLFVELGEKPKIEASRIGLKKLKGSKCRPVKATLSSSTSVQQILRKAKHLHQIEKYKSVFLSPDRSVEQRAEQKKLVTELKQRARDEPDGTKRYYIKGGQICCSEKSAKS